MCSVARVDGKPFRLLGPKPDAVAAMSMASLEVTPTRTTYVMEGGGVRILMTFLSPLLPHDLNILARPVTYLTWDVQAADGKSHDVSLYFDATGEWAVNKPEQGVTWSRDRAGKLDWLRIGSSEQPVLAKSGDDLRIDWGYFYVAAPHSGGMSSAIARDETARGGFVARGKLPDADDTRSPRPARQDWPVLAFAFDLGRVGEVPQSRHVLLAYDELSTVEYMGRRLDPLWKGEGWDVSDLLLRRGVRLFQPQDPLCRVRRRADGATWSGSAARNTPASAPSPIARPRRAQARGRLPRASRCSSPRRTSPTAASPRST